MKCPVCSCRLRRVRSKNTIVDICSNCSGVWFDSGELQVFLRDLIKSQEISPVPTRLFKPREVEVIDQSATESRICPKCSFVMKTFNYAYDSNVFVDKCPECEGIWTDAGEVKQIARHLKEDPHASVVAQDIVKQQQSLNDLEEWADLGDKLSGRAGVWVWYMPKIIIPLGDDNERTKFPVLTLSIIILCIATFLVQLFGVSDLDAFVNRFGFVPKNFWSIGLITSMFLHGGFFHLLGNMYFLWIFGDNVEERFGNWGYLLFYLTAGIAACFSHTLFYMGSSVPMIGASGAISGIMGAYVIFYPKARLRLFCICRVVSIPACAYLTIWFLFQLLYGAISLSYDAVYGVAWLAHIGGFIFGILIAYFIKITSSQLPD